MKYKLFILFVFSLIEIGESMYNHPRDGLRRRRKKNGDGLPILPPQGGASSSKHVPEPKPASPKLTIASEPSSPKLTIAPGPSSPLSTPLEQSDQEHTSDIQQPSDKEEKHDYPDV
uniref:Candidate secreted effector n=1 Tax=Meloidogyne incognita TaxID=6306 RepID=A0A914LCF9_MELIC